MKAIDMAKEFNLICKNRREETYFLGSVIGKDAKMQFIRELVNKANNSETSDIEVDGKFIAEKIIIDIDFSLDWMQKFFRLPALVQEK